MIGKSLPALRIWLPLAAALLLSGCGQSSMDELKGELNAIIMKPRGKIDPLPQPVVVSTFVYAAHQLRSPFTPPGAAQAAQIALRQKVEPHPNRLHEPLESYPLDALHMRGSLDWSKTGQVQQAIVEDPNGQEHLVRVGNYMGKNQGRIVGITSTQIALVEIVPDGRWGWVERPRSLLISPSGR